jgi:hypothetical protein
MECALLKWLGELDPPTRAAIIGASATLVSVGFALLGVSLTLLWNRQKHREDRAVALKRETYLSTSDTVAEARQWLALAADPKTELASGNAVNLKLAGALHKLHILGDKKAIASVIAFQRGFLEQYVSIAVIKGRLANTRSSLENLTRTRDHVASVEDKNDIGGFDAFVAQLSSVIPAIERLEEEDFELQSELRAKAGAAASALAPIMTAIALEMKRELQIPIDETWYREQLQDLSQFSEKLEEAAISQFPITPVKKGKPKQ